jgi:hypothetical protein
VVGSSSVYSVFPDPRENQLVNAVSGQREQFESPVVEDNEVLAAMHFDMRNMVKGHDAYGVGRR